jgi:hypothetical protein
MKKSIFTLAFIVFTIVSSFSDVLTLNNSLMFEGKILKIENCEVTFEASNGIKYLIPVVDIFYIEFENPSDIVYTKHLKLSESDPDKCMKAKIDAENYHGKESLHFALGLLFGPFAIIGAALSKPTPQKGQETYSMSKNKDLFEDPVYLNCYTKRARAKNVQNTVIGWGGYLLFILMILV